MTATATVAEFDSRSEPEQPGVTDRASMALVRLPVVPAALVLPGVVDRRRAVDPTPQRSRR
jgi:hypothetical protein